VGPTTRASCALAAWSEIALGRSSGGIAFATIACIAGAVNANTVPTANANGNSVAGLALPVRVTVARPDITSAMNEYVVSTMRLRSSRSATTPATGVKKSIGEKLTKNSRPSHVPFVLVSRDISACNEMNAIQKPN
jgi:hypothetical protein